MEQPPHAASPNPLESRLSQIEVALKLEERLKAVETSLCSQGLSKAHLTPWWKDAKTVTILGAIIAAVLPLITAINGILQNSRDAQRILIEQQDKIRQTYLDRVLKPGVTEGEQQRIFSLLVKLKSDPEFREWAQEEYTKVIRKVDELTKEKESLEKQNKELISQLEVEKQKSILSPNEKQGQAAITRRRLEREVVQAQQKVTEIKQRIGEPINAPVNEEASELRGIVVSIQGEPISNVRVVMTGGGAAITDRTGRFIIPIPTHMRLGEAILLRASKADFKPITQHHIVGATPVTIVMEGAEARVND